jgi:hypothetical protein
MLSSAVSWVSFSARKPRPKGTTFRIVSHEGLVNSLEAQDCARRFWKHSLPLPHGSIPMTVLSPKRREVVYPWILQQSRASSRPILTQNAEWCSVFRLGTPDGKGRLFHVVPSTFKAKWDSGEAALNRWMDDILARREPQHDRIAARRDRPGASRKGREKPFRRLMPAWVTGGLRDHRGAVSMLGTLETVFAERDCPTTLLWGLPPEHSTSVLTCPKLGRGTVFIGIKKKNPFAKGDVASLLRWGLSEGEPVPVAPKSVRDLTHEPTSCYDAPITPENWENYFSRRQFQPGDRVFVGPHQVWPMILPKPKEAL